jgi:indole-3-glycerol phosphate synthase
MMGNLLTAVVASSRRSAEERARTIDRASLDRRIARRPPRGDLFRASLARAGVRVIAECKRRSPSRGVLREAYDPVQIASAYAAAGAAAISVLTEPTFFDGALGHLEAVRAAVECPLLCKDFIVTEHQVWEAAAAGADAVLTIAAAVDDDDLRRLLRAADDLGLAVLVEVHDRDELGRVLDAGARVVGVNSRDLRTLEVHTELLDELGPSIPASVIAVAESGLKTADDVRRLRRVRYDAFLIGERFMIEADPGDALGTLIARAADAIETKTP